MKINTRVLSLSILTAAGMVSFNDHDIAVKILGYILFVEGIYLIGTYRGEKK